MLKRNKPLRANPDKVREWQDRSRTPLKKKRIRQRGKERSLEEIAYSLARGPFLREHPICPVTGEEATQIHHSAKREREWLNLQRYWIGVSMRGHELIERHKGIAESVGLMVRVRETYRDHVSSLVSQGLSLTIPIFYDSWDGKPLEQHFC